MNIFIQSRSTIFDYQWYEVRSDGDVVADHRSSAITDRFCRLVPDYHAAAMFLQGQITEAQPSPALLLAGIDTGRQDVGNRNIAVFLLVENDSLQEVYTLADHFIGKQWPPDSGGEFFGVFRDAVEAGIKLWEWTERRAKNLDEPREKDPRPDTRDAGRALREYWSNHSRGSLPQRGTVLTPQSVTNYDPERVAELLSWLTADSRASFGPPVLQAMVVAPWKTAPAEVRTGWDDDRWANVPILIHEDGPPGWNRRDRVPAPPKEIILVQPKQNGQSRLFGIRKRGRRKQNGQSRRSEMPQPHPSFGFGVVICVICGLVALMLDRVFRRG